MYCSTCNRRNSVHFLGSVYPTNSQTQFIFPYENPIIRDCGNEHDIFTYLPPIECYRRPDPCCLDIQEPHVVGNCINACKNVLYVYATKQIVYLYQISLQRPQRPFSLEAARSVTRPLFPRCTPDQYGIYVHSIIKGYSALPFVIPKVQFHFNTQHYNFDVMSFIVNLRDNDNK